ncbi:MAG: LPS assembly lipoprotein LptE [Desulfobulbaceae bacterium]
MRRSTIIFLILAGLAVISGGCGYYFPHVYEGPVKTIYMPNWKNRTSQLGLDSKIYQQLSRWFQKSRSIKMTKERSEADLILAGEIIDIDLPSISWDQSARATEVKVRLQVRYVLKDIKTDEILWEVPRELWTEDYSTGRYSVNMADNEQKALAEILKDMSERIYLGTLEKLRAQNVQAGK